MYDLRITIYELRFTIWIFARLRAEKRSEGAAEFLKQGELLARKRPVLRHAILTQRRPIGVCFGVASRLLIPLGQKLSLLANLPYSRRQFSPCGQKLHFCPIPLRTLGGFAGFATSYIVHRP